MNKKLISFIEILLFYLEFCYVVFKLFIGMIAIAMFDYLTELKNVEVSLFLQNSLQMLFIGYILWVVIKFQIKFISRISNDDKKKK